MRTDESHRALSTDFALAEVVRHARLPICITDPRQQDNPIILVNEAFENLTGYARSEIVGRNCRFLQGTDTTRESIVAVREIIAGRSVDTVEILNYRKDGSPFLNALQIGPILDDDGELLYFFGSQLDISAKREAEREVRRLADAELLHRLRNIVNVMTAVTRMTAREETDPAALGQKVVERLTTLAEVHFSTILQPREERLEFGDLARSILKAYAPLGEAQYILAGPDYPVPHRLISAVTLALHELATNAVKHGALGCRDGKVDLRWWVHPRDDHTTLEFLWQESGGPAVTAPEDGAYAPTIRKLVAATGGVMTFDWRPEGLVASAAFTMRK